MAEKINTGTILIEDGALWPESLRFESEPFAKGWRLVKNLDSRGLDQKIREAGWTFFYMGGEVPATAVGLHVKRTAHRVVKKVIASMKSDKFNCLEIVQVATKGFLGLPYVTVSARLRHIQERMFLSYAARVVKCDRAEPAVLSG